ncbi:MAG: DUF4190 domain-containing protein [Actinomycetota bacterium]|nr:DUF4190 domain-containing protein [Actinomycetota bacterium]
MASSGWFADPTGRHEKRYFNGLVWTDRVLDGALHASDQIGNVTPQSPQYVVVAPQPTGNGFAVAALTLGIIGAVIALSPFGSVLGGVCGLLALAFGLVGLRNVARHGAGYSGLAISGVILGSVAIMVASYTAWNWYRLDRTIQHAFSAQAAGPVIDANPRENRILITRCYRMTGAGAPAATGTLVNNSRERHSFKVTIAFHIGRQSVLGYGITDPVDPGEQGRWFARDLSASFPPSSCTTAPPPNPIP